MSSNEVKLTGTDRRFRVSEKVKRYTLLDNGFVESSPGKFRLERQLGGAAKAQSPKLKIVISNEFSKLKLSTTTANGLKELDLFQNDNHVEEVELLEATLYQLTTENVLEEL